jgi:hypothetical protein
MRTVECYAIMVWDGGDRHNLKGYITSKEEAKKHLVGNTYDRIEPRTFFFFDTYEQMKDYESGELRKRALAKLTAIERKALGLA